MKILAQNQIFGQKTGERTRILKRVKEEEVWVQSKFWLKSNICSKFPEEQKKYKIPKKKFGFCSTDHPTFLCFTFIIYFLSKIFLKPPSYCD